jgi:hypothetical protein
MNTANFYSSESVTSPAKRVLDSPILINLSPSPSATNNTGANSTSAPQPPARTSLVRIVRKSVIPCDVTSAPYRSTARSTSWGSPQSKRMDARIDEPVNSNNGTSLFDLIDEAVLTSPTTSRSLDNTNKPVEPAVEETPVLNTSNNKENSKPKSSKSLKEEKNTTENDNSQRRLSQRLKQKQTAESLMPGEISYEYVPIVGLNNEVLMVESIVPAARHGRKRSGRQSLSGRIKDHFAEFLAHQADLMHQRLVKKRQHKKRGGSAKRTKASSGKKREKSIKSEALTEIVENVDAATEDDEAEEEEEPRVYTGPFCLASQCPLRSYMPESSICGKGHNKENGGDEEANEEASRGVFISFVTDKAGVLKLEAGASVEISTTPHGDNKPTAESTVASAEDEMDSPEVTYMMQRGSRCLFKFIEDENSKLVDEGQLIGPGDVVRVPKSNLTFLSF